MTTPRRGRLARLIGGVAAVGALGLGASAWRIHRDLGEHTGEVLGALSSAIGLPVEADEVAVAWWPPGMVVRGLRIPDRSSYGPGSLAHADEARLRMDVGALLRGEAVIDSIELDTPVVRLVRGLDGGWNVKRLAEPADRHASSGRAMWPGGAASHAIPIRVETVRVTRGRFSIRDRAIPGVPEFEITSAGGRAWREGAGYVFELVGHALGGPEGNVRGMLSIPGGDGDAVLKISAASVPSRRLPEVMQLLRGEVPFGATLDGVVSAEIEGRVPATWPPESASLDVTLDARDALVRLAEGYVEKRPGTPLQVALGLRAREDRLVVEHATLASGEARILVAAAKATDDRQPPLRVSSVHLAAERLAEWVPMLGALAPQGDLALDGKLAPGEASTAAHLRLAGAGLRVRLDDQPAQLGAASLDLEVRPEGRYAAGLALEDLHSGDLHAERIAAALEAGPDRVTLVRIDGAHGGRSGAELDRVAVECRIEGDSAEVRRLEIEGLGGRLHGDGAIVRTADDAFDVRFQPSWDGVDAAGVLQLAGIPPGIRGSLEGTAALTIRREDGRTVVDTLRGVFAARLVDGEVPQLNLARNTVDHLRAVPGLREAIEKRAQDRIPALLAATSRIEVLEVGGSVLDGSVGLSRFRLQAPDYSIDARGRVALNGDFDLDGDLVLGEHATAALASASGMLALLAPPGEAIRIPVSIEGVYPELVSAPSPAFLSGAAPNAAPEEQAATGFLRRLLGSAGIDPSGVLPGSAPREKSNER